MENRRNFEIKLYLKDDWKRQLLPESKTSFDSQFLL